MSSDNGNPQRHFATLAVHAGQAPDPTTKARAVPIYQTTSYVFDDADHAARLFALKEFGNIYTRIMNPTTDVFEKRIAALEGGIAGLALASGQAAETLTIITLACGRRRDRLHHFALRRHLQPLPLHAAASWASRSALSMPKISTACAPPSTAAPRPCTPRRVGNPKLDIRRHRTPGRASRTSTGCRFVVDNTTASPALCRPIEWGADIVVNSATKFIGGHGTSIGGVIVDSGKFDWKASGRFRDFVEPDPSYHGVSYTEAFGPAGVHHQGARAGPARYRRLPLAVQCLPAAAGRRDAASPHAAPLGERAGSRALPRDASAKSSGSTIPACRRASITSGRRNICPTAPARWSPSAFAAATRRGARSSIRSNSSACWPTSATPSRWSSTPLPPPTSNSARKSSAPPASRPSWCGSRSASRTCATSSPTSTRRWGREARNRRRRRARSHVPDTGRGRLVMASNRTHCRSDLHSATERLPPRGRRRAAFAVTLRYAVYGELNRRRDNAILVCHALSGLGARGRLVAGAVCDRRVRHLALLRHRDQHARLLLWLHRTGLTQSA